MPGWKTGIRVEPLHQADGPHLKVLIEAVPPGQAGGGRRWLVREAAQAHQQVPRLLGQGDRLRPGTRLQGPHGRRGLPRRHDLQAHRAAGFLDQATQQHGAIQVVAQPILEHAELASHHPLVWHMGGLLPYPASQCLGVLAHGVNHACHIEGALTQHISQDQADLSLGGIQLGGQLLSRWTGLLCPGHLGHPGRDHDRQRQQPASAQHRPGRGQDGSHHACSSPLHPRSAPIAISTDCRGSTRNAWRSSPASVSTNSSYSPTSSSTGASSTRPRAMTLPSASSTRQVAASAWASPATNSSPLWLSKYSPPPRAAKRSNWACRPTSSIWKPTILRRTSTPSSIRASTEAATSPSQDRKSVV